MNWPLIERGLASFKQPFPVMKREVLFYQDQHLFIEHEHAFAMIYIPARNALEQVPQVMHFYSEGGRKETRALVDEVLNTVKAKGYNTLRAINGSGRRDAAWLRAFRHKDWMQNPVKTVYDFEVKKDE